MTIKLGIVIGRFQPVHKGHIQEVIAPACENSDYVLFLLGSANRSTNIKNPFSVAQRADMIRLTCESMGLTRAHLKFEGISDYKYSDERWLREVQSKVASAINAIRYLEGQDVSITLFGSKTDGSSYYLDLFPSWTLSLGTPYQTDTHTSTTVRDRLCEGRADWQELVPDAVVTWLNTHYVGTPLEETMKAENAFISKYKKQFKRPVELDVAIEELDSQRLDQAPASKMLISNLSQRMYYDPYFITVDSVVLWRGQVLLIKRGHQPGKGLWALPGGFLNQNERLLTGAIREVQEETGFKLRPEWLVAQGVFDDPERSLRGRTITHGFCFKVPHLTPNGKLEDTLQAKFIRGMDDAADAQWVPLADALENPNYTHCMFEDHADILYELVSKV